MDPCKNYMAVSINWGGSILTVLLFEVSGSPKPCLELCLGLRGLKYWVLGWSLWAYCFLLTLFESTGNLGSRFMKGHMEFRIGVEKCT